MTNDWVITLTFDIEPTNEQFEQLADFLEDSDASLARIPGAGITATTHAFADLDLLEATEQGVKWLSMAIGAEPTGIEVLTMTAYAERAEAPSMPELMSAAEIADELGVSRQRVHQLRSTAGFPDPLADLRGGAVWDAAAIRNFNEEWTRKPGRPKTVDVALDTPEGTIFLEVKTTTRAAAAVRGNTRNVRNRKPGTIAASRSATTGRFLKKNPSSTITSKTLGVNKPST